MKRTYKNIGWTPMADGRFLVYEIDWNHIHERLSAKALKNKSGQTTMGPLRIRIVDKAHHIHKAKL
jgi:hypothetical protein